MRVAGLVGVALVAGLAAAALAATGGAGRAGAARATQAVGDRGFFRSRCDYSHTRSDDPILLPRQAGMSMVHDFFGNATTTAASTATALRAATATSCLAPGDTSAYWFPALYQHGRKVTPTRLLAYYRTAGRPAATIATLPVGLQMIAGNEAAMTPQSTAIASWNCGAQASVLPSATPPTSCPAGTQLVLSLSFPDCWDGHTLAGATQRNVAYAVRRRCPAGYPVAIPQVSVHVHYPISNGTGLTLSMGPTSNTMPGSIYSAHADLINAWNPSVLASLVSRCDMAAVQCGTVGADDEPMGVSPREQARAAARRAQRR